MKTSSSALIIASLPHLADQEILPQDQDAVEPVAAPGAADEPCDPVFCGHLIDAAAPRVNDDVRCLASCAMQLVDNGAVGRPLLKALELRDSIVDSCIGLPLTDRG